MNSRAGHPARLNIPFQSFMPRPEQELIYRLINDLVNPELRKNALLELCKRRDTVPDLGPMLYHSFGTLSVLLQEIISIYPLINPPAMNTVQSNTVCNVLALLQCIASHPETRLPFLAANIHRFIYPFLEIIPKSRAFEYLNLTSLGVFGGLVKNDDQEVVNYLLSSEMIPYCLRNMEHGCDLSKTVAAYILQKILVFDNGLNYVCQTYERFSHVAMILGKMVLYIANEQPASGLVKHVIKIYTRLSENPRAREALRQCLPDEMKDNTLLKYLKEDDAARNWLTQLHHNLKSILVPPQMSVPMQLPMSVPMPMPDEHMPYMMH